MSPGIWMENMSAKILDGVALSREILDGLAVDVKFIEKKTGRRPGLVTILTGENPASASYVARKIKTAEALGFHDVLEKLPETATEVELLELIEKYNGDVKIHGILVQLPLPGHMDEKKIINAINPDKDVDCFHPVNLGKMLVEGSKAAFLPCTPAGIQEMLRRAGVELDGAEVVVVGRSNIVGKPIAVLLAQKGPAANSTVTITHTRTKDLAGHCKRADVLIVAAGVPGLIKPQWVKPGATVIDVGVNRIGFNEKTGKAKLCGDVDFAETAKIAGMITPVPGGVGPLTIAMLMKNTVKSAKRHLGLN